jgi:hypothetical protein
MEQSMMDFFIKNNGCRFVMNSKTNAMVREARETDERFVSKVMGMVVEIDDRRLDGEIEAVEILSDATDIYKGVHA